ncbi:hypothetical protein MMC26_007812 [Xylographa opegraphella]|nr:hypothetical protein [Xylographa opegraphella]
MEVLGSIVTIITVCDQVRKIYDFWSSVQDAPVEVAVILENLQAIQAITERLAKDPDDYSDPDAPLHTVLQTCSKSIVRLEALLADFDISSPSRRKRRWAAVKAVWKRDQLEKFQVLLERTKSSLVLATQLKSEHNTRFDLAIIAANVDDIKARQENTIITTISAQSELSDISSHVKSIRAEVHGMAQKFEQSSGVFKVSAEIESVMSTLLAKALSSTEMQHAIDSIIASNRVNEGLQGIKSVNITGVKDLDTIIKRQDSLRVQEVPLVNPEDSIVSSRTRERQIIQRHYERTDTKLGTFYYYTKIMSVQTIRWGSNFLSEQSGPLQVHEIETCLTMVPAEWLLKYGATISCGKTPRGFSYQFYCFPVVREDSLIFEFCQQGNIAGIKSLFARKLASPIDTDSQGLTPLHVAATYGNTELCAFLLEQGANVNTVDYKYHHTAAHKLMWHPQRDPKTRLQVSRLLAEYGADFSMEDHQGWTPYTIGTANLLESSAHDWLLRQGSGTDFDPSARDVGGFTTLHTFMSVVGGPAIIDLLLRLGSNANDTLEPPPKSSYGFYRGRTALHFLTYRALTGRVLKKWPSKENFIAIASLLFDSGADPHVLTVQGYSPTMIAMREYEAFCWWRESVGGAGYDMEEFVEKECQLSSKMIKQGWNKEGLRSLFDSPLPRPNFLEKADFAQQQAWWKAQVETHYPSNGIPQFHTLQAAPRYNWLTRPKNMSSGGFEFRGYCVSLRLNASYTESQLALVTVYIWPTPGQRRNSTGFPSSQHKMRGFHYGAALVVVFRRRHLTFMIVLKASSARYRWRLIEEVDDYEHVAEVAYILADQCQSEKMENLEAKRRWFTKGTKRVEEL